jgi:hypothetical protein
VNDDNTKRRDGAYCFGDPGVLAYVVQADYHRAKRAYEALEPKL